MFFQKLALSPERLQSTLSKHEYKPKLKNVQHKVRSIKSLTHGTEAGKCTIKEKDVPFAIKGKEQNDLVSANLSNVQHEHSTAVVTPINNKPNIDISPSSIARNTPTYPEEHEPLPPKRFERSSTQNAVTGPLKLPRLANPFPEPVKVMMSHETLSDQEKADLMLEEVKMEQKFREQQKYEEQQRRAGRDAKGAEYGNRSIVNRRNFSSLANIFPKYAPNQLEQCELILQTLRREYPECELPRKTPFLPGSPEEQQFIE